mmetsp:Transcript_91184/g.162376  ORF Transcript_91184/g.162376 Transcript_91184/m.162376 type:complete len:261 (-) Transcript_91184:153-935(-)
MAVMVMSSPVSPARNFDFDYRSPARASPVVLGGTGCSEDLEEVCTTSRMRISQWRKEQCQNIQQEVHRGLQEVGRDEDMLDDLKADLTVVKELTEAARKLRAEGGKLGEAISETVAATGRRSQLAISTRDYLLQAREGCAQEMRTEEQALRERRQAAGNQMCEIEDFLSRYREALGLDIVRAAPQTVKLIFTLLDQVQPTREFSVNLTLAAQGEGYEAFECSPEVPSLPDLLSKLNEDPHSPKALPGFFCGLREAFKAMC